MTGYDYLKEGSKLDSKLREYLGEDYESLITPSKQIPVEQLTKQDPNCIIVKKEKTNTRKKMGKIFEIKLQEEIKAQKMNVKDYVHHIKTNEDIYGKLTKYQTDVLGMSANLCEETLPNHSIPDFGSYMLQPNSKIPEQIIILASYIIFTGIHLRIAKNNPEKEVIGVRAVNHYLQNLENILTEYKN